MVELHLSAKVELAGDQSLDPQKAIGGPFFLHLAERWGVFR